MSIKVVAALAIVMARGEKVNMGSLREGYVTRQYRRDTIPRTAKQDLDELCKTLKEQGLLEGQ